MFAKKKNDKHLSEKEEEYCSINFDSWLLMNFNFIFGEVWQIWMILLVFSAVQEASSTQLPTVACKMEAQSEYIHVVHTYFAHFGANLHAQLVLINKNFCIGAQSEVYQECVVGRDPALRLPWRPSFPWWRRIPGRGRRRWPGGGRPASDAAPCPLFARPQPFIPRNEFNPLHACLLPPCLYCSMHHI